MEDDVIQWDEREGIRQGSVIAALNQTLDSSDYCTKHGFISANLHIAVFISDTDVTDAQVHKNYNMWRLVHNGAFSHEALVLHCDTLHILWLVQELNFLDLLLMNMRGMCCTMLYSLCSYWSHIWSQTKEYRSALSRTLCLKKYPIHDSYSQTTLSDIENIYCSHLSRIQSPPFASTCLQSSGDLDLGHFMGGIWQPYFSHTKSPGNGGN